MCTFGNHLGRINTILCPRVENVLPLEKTPLNAVFPHTRKTEMIIIRHIFYKQNAKLSGNRAHDTLYMEMVIQVNK